MGWVWNEIELVAVNTETVCSVSLCMLRNVCVVYKFADSLFFYTEFLAEPELGLQIRFT